jgi:hypothetical protein
MENMLMPLAVVISSFCSHFATPLVVAAVSPPPAAHAKPSPSPTPAIDPAALYARRSRRLVQSYLRLKLLEMRAADLERARRVIERKLGIGALLSETPSPGVR